MAKERKRLAVFVGQADESFQSRFISGFTKQAFARDMDVCVFSMYKKYQDTSEREMGESNIFALANPYFFDGIVILKDSIQTAGAAEEIERRLQKQYSGPVLIVDLESKFYKTVYIDCYTPVLELANHLIEDHGLTDIAFLTGKRKHPHSMQREEAFKDAMRNHELEVPEDRIIEGDFWYLSGEQCVDTLMSSGKPLPQAIMCANDPMAIGVCKAFTERGVRVPEDIIVVGADSSEEGMTSPKVITSYRAPAFEMGVYAVVALDDIANGRDLKKFTDKAELILGETCGCCKVTDSGLSVRRAEWDTEISSEGFDSVNSMMFENLMIHSDLLDYLGTVYSYAFQIKGAESFHLCLNRDIQDMGPTAMHGNEGYSDRMIHAVSYHRGNVGDMVGLEEVFEVDNMLPGLDRYRPSPMSFFFTPVFFENKCFGYACVSYTEPRSYDDIYRRWIRAVNLGFENLYKNITLAGMENEIRTMRADKFDKVDLAFAALSMAEKEDYELVKEIIDRNLLKYHFQPIVNAVDGSIYSYEALMRSGTRRKLSPLAILKYASMQDRFPDIESATFNNVLDIVERNRELIGDAKVFINSIPGVRVDDYEEISEKLRKNSDRIVVELTEEAELDEEDLSRLKEYFQSLNIEIAIDDYGTGYSNISNLLRYMPNYMKIDRSLLSEIQNKPQKQHFVREIIEFCHNNGIMALAEGVETSEELRTVIHLGADLIQGFYTGRPSAEFVGRINDRVINEIRSFYQERADGKFKNVYVAGKTNRVSLISLIKDGCTDIVIGQGNMVYKDITVVGMPSLTTEMHIRVESGYSGRVTLENVYLSNIKDRPCIELGENSDVSLIVKGYNTLKNTGICVPESASLMIEGDGNMKLDLTSSNFYGIGHDIKSRHGDITVALGGRLEISANGTTGTYIGSGLGGRLVIGGGQLELSGHSTDLVVIGALYADSDVTIRSCGIDMDVSATRNIGVGSLEGSSKVSMEECSFKYLGDGREVVGVGTLSGDSYVRIHNALAEFCIRGDKSTGLGSLDGASKLDFSIASVRVENAGEEALAFGGYSEDTEVNLMSVDTRVKVYNKLGKETFAAEDKVKIVNGRCKIYVNDVEVERELVFKFE